MEQGNASLVANFLMDTFPTFNNLSQDEKHTIFGPLAARLNHFHRCILTMRFVDDCSNEKVVLHYGFYYSPDDVPTAYQNTNNKLSAVSDDEWEWSRSQRFFGQ